MNIVAIIQARMGSTRLPGKVLMSICGKSILGHIVKRLNAVKQIKRVVIATTEMPSDDLIVEESEKYGVDYFRGSSDDVLERYYMTSREFNAEAIIRVTSDCPLIDPEIIDQMITHYKKLNMQERNVDYLSNILVRTFPRGYDIEIFSGKTLEITHRDAKEQYEREHVTPYIYRNPDIFTLENYCYVKDASDYRLTLDTYEDLDVISEIYTELYSDGNFFGIEEVLRLLKRRPDIIKINAHIKQKSV